MAEKVLLIDRDGVINVDLMGDYIKTPQEFRFEKGVIETLKEILKRGYDLIIISNQAGVGDGVFSEEDLWDVHDHMVNRLKAEGVTIRETFYCLHGKNEGCTCRKPEIGLFEEALKEINFAKAETFYIGDKATDIEAGKKFGLKTIFLRTGHGLNDEKKLVGDLKPNYVFDGFADVLEVLH